MCMRSCVFVYCVSERSSLALASPTSGSSVVVTVVKMLNNRVYERLRARGEAAFTFFVRFISTEPKGITSDPLPGFETLTRDPD